MGRMPDGVALDLSRRGGLSALAIAAIAYERKSSRGVVAGFICIVFWPAFWLVAAGYAVNEGLRSHG